MRVAVVGGGINGVMSAWALAASGATVTRVKGSHLVLQRRFGAGLLLQAESRDHKLEWTGRVLNVVGGKWTTSRKLGMDVANEILGADHPRHKDNIIWSNA